MQTKSTILLKNILVLPGILFCSCKTVLIFKLCAALITGYVTYPPTQITTSGLNSFIILIHSFFALAIKNIFLKSRKILVLLKPYISIGIYFIPNLIIRK